MWILSGLISPLWQLTQYIWVVDKTIKNKTFDGHFSTFSKLLLTLKVIVTALNQTLERTTKLNECWLNDWIFKSYLSTTLVWWFLSYQSINQCKLNIFEFVFCTRQSLQIPCFVGKTPKNIQFTLIYEKKKQTSEMFKRGLKDL